MQKTLSRKLFQKINITPHSEWAQKFWDDLIPLKNKVVHHPYFSKVQTGELPIDLGYKGLINFYPLVENFPKYMALNLAKVKRGEEGHEAAKYWLIQNIKVEQNHADWWHLWAHGFGITDEQLKCAQPSPLMDAINYYLWYINTYGSLIEGVAATNLAIEWATGEWTINIIEGVKSYAKQGLANIDDKTMSWLTAHASYDDKHPDEAMEVIKLCVKTKEDQDKAFAAAERSLQYYVLALDDCYRA